ncbi:hypothetical protein GGI22_006367, partial [Coemansia erecta]
TWKAPLAPTHIRRSCTTAVDRDSERTRICLSARQKPQTTLPCRDLRRGCGG